MIWCNQFKIEGNVLEAFKCPEPKAEENTTVCLTCNCRRSELLTSSLFTPVLTLQSRSYCLSLNLPTWVQIVFDIISHLCVAAMLQVQTRYVTWPPPNCSSRLWTTFPSNHHSFRIPQLTWAICTLTDIDVEVLLNSKDSPSPYPLLPSNQSYTSDNDWLCI